MEVLVYEASNMRVRANRRWVSQLLRQGYAVSHYESPVVTQYDRQCNIKSTLFLSLSNKLLLRVKFVT